MTLDLPDKGANVLSQRMFDELEAAITPCLERTDIEGLILVSAKPRIFVAGANLDEIQAGLDWPDERIIEFSRRGRQVMSLFHQAPFTTVSAIHGACVGGGFELALWCDYRVATKDRSTVIGLPEVKLGLIPGWAGTVRVARLAGIEAQLELVTTAKLLGAEEAESLGLVDATTEVANLLETAVNLVRTTSSTQRQLRRDQVNRPVESLDTELLTRKYTPLITKPGNAIYPVAPLIALEHMLRAATLPMDEACESESRSFAAAWGSPPSYGLLHHFFLNDYARKRPAQWIGEQHVAPFKSVAIVGLGVMGAAIAELHSQLDMRRFLVEPDPEKIKQFRETSKCDEEQFEFCSAISELPGVDLVIEAVPEIPELKKTVLSEMEGQVGEQTIVVTNTSAIPVSSLAEHLNRPQQFCGMHFCHPTLMKLVELVPGKQTVSSTMARVAQHIRGLRKFSIFVQDSPGFAVNRLLSCLFQKSIEAALGGVSVETIDKHMREFGFQAGPFEIMDVIGVDTCVYAGRAMWDGGLRTIDTSPLLPKMMKTNRLGRKTLAGFYRYEGSDGPPQPDPELHAILADYQQPKSRAFDSSDVTRILLAMADEGRRMLDSGVVEDSRDLDLATIFGFGFPAHLGGVMFFGEREVRSSKA